MLNETHDSALSSWVESANDPQGDFPIQNLPFAEFRRRGRKGEAFRAGVAIGDQILDMDASIAAGAFASTTSDSIVADAAAALTLPALNDFMSLGPSTWSAVRLSLSRMLRRDSSQRNALRACLVPQSDAEYALPARIGDYTDFYTSIHHATAVGTLFRPDAPLLPNYKWLPVGYHGRSSSIGVSGQEFKRPWGQVLAPGASEPTLSQSRRLDYELELGVFVGPGNTAGARIEIDAAEAHVFGLCLLNDWSARDLQVWEYQPLGPFLAKNFATTISPWIVTLEALAPYRVPFARPPLDPPLLSYLDSPAARRTGAIDIRLEAYLETQRMRTEGHAPQRLSQSSFKHAYWTLAQMVAHHTVNGCNLRPGDLLGTGTQSGPSADEAGSLLELSNAGKWPLSFPNGETRTFLEDGDDVILRAYCQSPDRARVGFGEARGRVIGG